MALRGSRNLLSIRWGPNRMMSSRAIVPSAFDATPTLLKEMTKDLTEPLLLYSSRSEKRKHFPAQKLWFRRDALDYFYVSGGQEDHHTYPYEIKLPGPGKDRENLVRSFITWALRNPTMKGVEMPEEGDMLAARDGHETRHLPPSFLKVFGPLLDIQEEASTTINGHATIQLLHLAQQYNAMMLKRRRHRPLRVYITQTGHLDLPPHLAKDLPTPQIALEAGRGDIYGDSIWLGTERTYSHLHRDPNHNLFYQLLSSKRVRLLPPTSGLALFHQTHAELGLVGNPNIRGPEMLNSEQSVLLDAKVWALRMDSKNPLEGLQEVQLGPGDVLFIPMGWWHSVRSKGCHGALNASANWWFR